MSHYWLCVEYWYTQAKDGNGQWKRLVELLKDGDVMAAERDLGQGFELIMSALMAYFHLPRSGRTRHYLVT